MAAYDPNKQGFITEHGGSIELAQRISSITASVGFKDELPKTGSCGDASKCQAGSANGTGLSLEAKLVQDADRYTGNCVMERWGRQLYDEKMGRWGGRKKCCMLFLSEL